VSCRCPLRPTVVRQSLEYKHVIMFFLVFTLLATLITPGAVSFPAPARTAFLPHSILMDADVLNSPTNVRAVPGDPAASHYIIVSFTDNSPDETGFEISNGNMNGSQNAPPSAGTGATVVWNWWMPRINSYMCVRVRAYRAGDVMSYSAWAPVGGWACTTSS
jgi:hypothetical protein